LKYARTDFFHFNQYIIRNTIGHGNTLVIHGKVSSILHFLLRHVSRTRQRQLWMLGAAQQARLASRASR